MSANANHTSSSNAHSSAAPQIAVMETLEPRLLLSGDGIDIEKFVYVEPVSDPGAGDIMCNDYAYGKPVELTMKYTGGGSDATDTMQPLGKYGVTDEPGFLPGEAVVDIIASSSSNLACVSPGNTFFSGEDIALGDEFVLDVDNAYCQDKFSANTYIFIMDTSGELLQTVQYHTSCSAPIHLGDIVGGIEVNGFFGTNGIGNDLDNVTEEPGIGEDADTAGEAINADIGRTVVWTYVLTNIDQEPLSGVSVVDDNGTPGNPADDFSPAAVMNGDFNVGDTNTDGLLDIGEEWLFTASALVQIEGLYGNTATASVTIEGPVTGDPEGFVNYAVLSDGMVSIGDYFSVDGGMLGTNNGDVFAFGHFEAPAGVAGSGTFGELGGSLIGTAGGDAIVFNGGVMVYTESVVNGDIRVGDNFASVFGYDAEINGDIYTGGDASTVELYDIDYNLIDHLGWDINELDNPAPFEALDFTPLDDFNPTYDLDKIFGHVIVDDFETLPLTAGDYYFDSLNFGLNATLALTLTDGPISIYVKDVDNNGMTIGHDFNVTLIDGGADEVFIEVDSNLFVGDRATMAGTIYSPDGDMIFGSDLRHTGAIYGGSSMSFAGDAAAGGASDITFAPLDFAALGINVGPVGGGGDPIVLSDTDSAHFVGILPATDLSEIADRCEKPETLVMQYTGDNVIDHSQHPCSVHVTGDPQDAATVWIVASSKSNPDDPRAEIYFAGEVNLGDTFTIEALAAGKTKLKNDVFVTVYDMDGEVLGTANFDTSLHQPLVLGDQFGAIRLVGFVGEDGTRAGIVPFELQTGLSGFVFEDANGDGQVDQDEYAVSGATVTLTGVNDQGVEIDRVEITDSDGAYYFDALRPGTYTITETQPLGYDDGIDSIGTAGGTLLASDSVEDIQLEAYVEGENYNFAEIRADAGEEQIVVGQTATIGFWAGRKGRKLIESLNGDKNSTLLGNWLAAELPEIYGDLAGKSNKKVAKYYRKLFRATKKHRRRRHHHHGHHDDPQTAGIRDLGAQVMATALAVYVTDSNLAGTTAESYGFLVTSGGVGLATFNVGDAGDAFGLSELDSRIMTVFDILRATNDQVVDGSLYDMDLVLSTLADRIYTMINETGGIN
jgi:hypothetical protein